MIATVALAAVSLSKFFLVPLLPGYEEAQICGLAADGRAVLGYQTAGDKKTAFLWDEKSGLRNLGGLSWNMWRAGIGPMEFDEKGNPIDRVRLKAAEVRWARTVALMAVPKTDFRPFKTPWVLGSSADGKTLFGNGVGKNGSEGFTWSKAGGVAGIGDLPGGFFYSQAIGISPEGKWVAGCSKSFDGLTAALWSRPTGLLALRYEGQGRAVSRAVCASLDAKTVGGETETAKGLEAVVWLGRSAGLFVRDLAGDKLPAGCTLASVECVSDDGKAIAGTAVKDGKSRVWLAAIAER